MGRVYTKFKSGTGKSGKGKIGKGSTADHQRCVNKLIAAIQSAFGQKVFVMKQVTGTFQRVGGGGVFKVGVPGMADIGGWVADEEYSWAIPFQVEVKTGSAQPNRRQVDFAKACDVSGCFHILADFRHPEDSKYVDSRIVDVVCNLQTASLSKLSGMAPF